MILGHHMTTHNAELKIVDDFREFCSFMETERPTLSAKKGVLGKKESFAVNSRFHYQREVTEPKHQQEHYPCLELLFTLALEGQLFIRTKDEKNKLCLQRTRRLDDYYQLNRYEQYAFLLETYWCYFNFEEYFNSMSWGGNLFLLQELFKEFLETGAGNSITRSNYIIKRSLKCFFTFDAAVIYHLTFFNFCDYEINEEAFRQDDPKFVTITPTTLGVDLAGLLLRHGFKYRPELLFPLAYRTLAASQGLAKVPKGFHKVLAKAFPVGTIKKTVEQELEQREGGTYYFKVALRKNLWRIIKLSHTHSLESLHLAIQDAFNLDDDHLHVFYLEPQRKGRRMKHGIYCSEIEDEIFTTDQIHIGDCGFYPGQVLTYLYDFGDMITFDVTLLEIDYDEPLPLHPVIAEKKGDPPDWYPAWE